MNKKLLEIFKNEKVYVSFDNKEEAETFLNDCYEYGLSWANGVNSNLILLTNEHLAFTFNYKNCGFLQFASHDSIYENSGYKKLKYHIEKEYTFKEVIFIIKPNETYTTRDNFKISCLSNGTIKITTPMGKAVGFYENDLFIKESIPVSFPEAIKLGERIKIEHKLLEGFDFANKYNDINDLFLWIGSHLNTSQINDIIKNGKCYIENK